MDTVTRPTTHRESLGLLVTTAGARYTAAAVGLTLGLPLLAYLSGSASALFYVHVALGAFWFGLDLFFKFVLGPSLEAAEPDAATAVNRHLVPRMVVVAEPLSLGVVASGVGLAHLLGYWAFPTNWLWAALALAAVMLAVGFGPLHSLTTKMAVEFSAPDPDADRLGELFDGALKWGFVQTILMLAIVGAMTGIRGV